MLHETSARRHFKPLGTENPRETLYEKVAKTRTELSEATKRFDELKRSKRRVYCVSTRMKISKLQRKLLSLEQQIEEEHQH